MIINNLKLIKNHSFSDERGVFSRLFDDRLIDESNKDTVFTTAKNVNLSRNPINGTVRGLHMQKEPHGETKIVTCIKGSIVDLIVDCRKDSSTYGLINSYILSEEENSCIIIPKGCLHAFLTIKSDTDVIYVTDNYYNKESEISASPMSPSLKMFWKGFPLNNISKKDKMSTDLANLIKIN